MTVGQLRHTYQVKCMLGIMPYSSLAFLHMSNVRSEVDPPAPQVMSKYSGSGKNHTVMKCIWIDCGGAWRKWG